MPIPAGLLQSVLEKIPFVSGVDEQQAINLQRRGADIQQATGLMGLLQHAQAQQEAQRKAQMMQQYQAGLRPNMSPEEQVSHASRFVTDPKDVLHYAGQQLTAREAAKDRLLQFMQTYQQKQDSIDEKKREFEQRTTDAKARETFNEWYKTESMRNQQAQNAIANSLRGMGIDIQRQTLEFRKDTQTEKQNLVEAQDVGQVNSLTSSMDRMAMEANRLLKHPGLSKTTGLMSIVPLAGGLATVPGTDAANFKAGLETLKSQSGFAVLQELRNTSKTGGALGQVSDFENRMLQTNLAALDVAQSEKEFTDALKKIVTYTDAAKQRINTAFKMKHKGKEPPKIENHPPAENVPEGIDPKVWAVMTPEEKALWKK